VIGGALLGILQRVIGLVDFLELVLGFGIARIAIGMKLHGELAISALEGRVIGAFLAAEHLVEIAFGQDQLSLFGRAGLVVALIENINKPAGAADPPAYGQASGV